MKKYWGRIASMNLYGCDSKKIKNKKYIGEYFVFICRKIKMKPYGKAIVKRFGNKKLEGISALQFIETSSITVHCDEIENRVFIDIFSCKDFDSTKALECSKKYFDSNKGTMWEKLR